VAPAELSPFVGWENFYVIVGSSAAALTGLQFVVIAIGSNFRAARGPEIGAFGTPNVVHFGAVLLVAAILSMPWHDISNAALALGACGAVGIAYVLIVVRRARGRMTYAPVLEDWIWHSVLPLVAYATVLTAATLLPGGPTAGLFAIAAAVLLLLFAGIHNAWDAVTYAATSASAAASDDKR
jgi:hypothetical protein